MLRTVRLTAAAAVAVALWMTAPVHADVLAAHARNGDFTFAIDVNNGDTHTFVPLDNAGLGQSAALIVPANARFIVSYTAECAVASPTTGTKVTLNVDLVAVNQANGVTIELPPTNGDQDIFCTSDRGPFANGPTMNAVNAVAVNIPAGTYRIAVRANVQGANGFGTGRLGDSSLVVWQ